MSEKMGPRTFGATSEMVFLGKEIHEQKDYSEETAREIDVEINSIIHTQYIIAKNIILKYKDRLDAIVAKLKEVETLERKDFEALFPEFVGQTSHERKEEEKKKSRSSIRPLTSPSAAT